WVYELTEYGEGLRAVLHVLAHWGARSLGPPSRTGDLAEGWLDGALRIAVPATSARIEFRIGDEVATVEGGEVCKGALGEPAAVVVGDAPGFYALLVEREIDAVTIEGRREVVEEMLAALPANPQTTQPVA